MDNEENIVGYRRIVEHLSTFEHRPIRTFDQPSDSPRPIAICWCPALWVFGSDACTASGCSPAGWTNRRPANRRDRSSSCYCWNRCTRPPSCRHRRPSSFACSCCAYFEWCSCGSRRCRCVERSRPASISVAWSSAFCAESASSSTHCRRFDGIASRRPPDSRAVSRCCSTGSWACPGG